MASARTAKRIERVNYHRSLMTPEDVALADWKLRWLSEARPEQVWPDWDWAAWILLAGRGYGKTKVLCETIGQYAASNPGIRAAAVAATQADLRKTLFEGDSGFRSVIPDCLVESYSRSDKIITLINGSMISGFSAEKPDRLRGPQFHIAGTDELAAWSRQLEAWDNLQLGLRLGKDTRTIVATTPRPQDLLVELVNDPQNHVYSGSTYENEANLSPKFFRTVVKRHEGTDKGEQELMGKILAEFEGALWKRAWLDETRVMKEGDLPPMKARVVAIDPPATSQNSASAEAGIVVCGVGENEHGYVLADYSGKMKPAEWAEKVLFAYARHKCGRIVAEVNQGGEMVENTIRSHRGTYSGATVPISKVWAHEGKRARAEPISALWQQGRAHIFGRHERLERQLTSWDPLGKNPSPDRLDAMVWGLTDLCLKGTHAFA